MLNLILVMFITGWVSNVNNSIHSFIFTALKNKLRVRLYCKTSMLQAKVNYNNIFMTTLPIYRNKIAVLIFRPFMFYYNVCIHSSWR